MSYTADVFGTNRRQVESLQAQADAQRYQLEATYLTLTSNVASAAIQEAGLRGQIDATREIIADQAKLMTMFQRQYDLGQVAVADVAAQEAALAAIQPRGRRSRSSAVGFFGQIKAGAWSASQFRTS